MFEQIEVGEVAISSKLINLKSKIKVCPQYGVVCSELGTWNGSIVAIAEQIVAAIEEVSYLRRELADPTYSVEVTIDGENVNCKGVAEITSILKNLYAKHNKPIAIDF